MRNFDYKKSLGQNFLKDNNIINKIVSSITPTSKDLIIEIGPGAGALTKKLIEKETDVICFEIDTRLKDVLSKIQSDKLTIIFEDFLKVNLNDYINCNKYERLFFVGNLPYYITTAIINKIVEMTNPYQITIMVQKEVCDRFLAKPCTKNYNSLSVFLQYNFDMKKICDVSKNCFEPIPKVDSSVIQFTRNIKYKSNNEDLLYKFIKDAFKQKRKNLKNNLKTYDLEKLEKILLTFNKTLQNRAEEITLEEYVDISNKY